MAFDYNIYIVVVESGAVFVCNAFVAICAICVMRKRSAFLLIGAMLTMDAIFGLGCHLFGLYTNTITDGSGRRK
jgi:hypothetical protein